MAYIQNNKIVRRPIGKTYFIRQPQLSGTDEVWDWISETASGAYGYVSGKVSGTWEEAKSYYDAIKNRWPEFLAVRPALDNLVVRLSVARMNADKAGDTKKVDDIDNLRIKVKNLTELWIAVKDKYDQYIGKWIGASQQEKLSGLGFVMIVIGVAAVAAAAYVATNMISVIADSKKLTELTDKVEAGTLSADQAIKIYKETRQTTPSTMETIAEKIGGGVGTGLTVAIVGAGAVVGLMYFMKRK